jgi:ribosomal-protein-alanine N-acetyltransferase
MHNFSPFPYISTARLALREIQVADAPLIHALRSDEATNALIDRKNSEGIEDALAFIDIIQKNVAQNESIYWIICLKDSPDLIGTICYYNLDPAAEAGEIGYELLTEHRDQGIMSELLPRIVQYGFDEMKLKTITAFPSEQNIGSVRLLEKCGFRLSSSKYDNTHDHVPGMLTYVLDRPVG